VLRSSPTPDALAKVALPAIEAAADSGLVRDGIPLANLLVDAYRRAGGRELPAEVVAHVAQGHQQRRLRFL